ncbi:hypothetical protein PN498_20120 [Oscillatoria sp. CS-180]|uniref:hypothetical protein n=1 Tax=Oscillatoria sp. CS-180 TaxID=3021720 RepID=UPI00232D7E31|nr:hypothetical protein [Oscillatoria sp. CS-180]MDB9528309.1 hypothetical protein [Oscillatoria sp. CS-180]
MDVEQPSETRARRSLFTRKWVWLFLTSAIVPPLLMSITWIWPGALSVIQTGTCPPSPPDIPAYPCSLGEYLFRNLFSLWIFMGHLITWMGWFVVNFILWGIGLLGVGLYRSWQSR